MHNTKLKTGVGRGELATRALMLGGELKNVFLFFQGGKKNGNEKLRTSTSTTCTCVRDIFQ